MNDIEMWRCKGCGRWSHAQRRPLAHQRVMTLEDPAEIREASERLSLSPGAIVAVDVMVWCGPFERFVATADDPDGSAASPRIGQRVPNTERALVEDDRQIADASMVF